MKLILKNSFFIILVTLLFSCTNTENNKITKKEDYNKYLAITQNTTKNNLKNTLNFWNTKLANNPNQYPYNAKLATNYSKLFSITGNINQLKLAEENLRIANEKVNYTDCGYLRSLSRNYISQHRFKEALALLEKAEKIGAQLKSTQYMLVDVYLELGNYTKVEQYLSKIKNTNDFNYLIRISKYADHKGNLNTAIHFLETSLEKAKEKNNKSLLQWNYTNLADYYGHAGRIKESYDSYLKALAIDPNDSYAKKGIAWIVYSYERNPEEALRILETITKENASPDYYLLMADIYEYQNNLKSKNVCLDKYFKAVKEPQYGAMYNSYSIELLAEEKETALEAVEIAKTEVQQRPTPQSYDLLAWAYFKNGHKNKALEIVNEHVLKHTSEPTALLHSAQILKANGKTDAIKSIKKDLLESIYELGPLTEKEIKNI
jgi:tetratricopeptide (TPR) repeat protein